MTGPYHSYLSPKLTDRPHNEKGGCGVFAVEPIAQAELLAMWGGRILSKAELDQGMPDFTQRVLQVEEDLYLLTPEALEPADCFNHSCSPNAGLSGQVAVVAMRAIAPGEEVCFDYAMCDGTNYDEFSCSCGSPECRGRIRGDDWSRPELWDRYAGYFMPYLQRRIDALKRERDQKRKLAVA
jgi:uncharacterized protein